MTRFRRSTHYRTNSHGTTFQVSGHEVNRDGSSIGHVAQARPFRAFEPKGSLLTPNARCPVCDEAVWYFEDRNGGRVFFDTVWPDWDKHPCTMSDELRVVASHTSGEEVEAGDFDLEVYPRAEGTVFGLRSGATTLWVKGELPLGKRVFPQAWARYDSKGTIEAIQLLGDDLAPFEIKVEPAAAPAAPRAPDHIAHAKAMLPSVTKFAAKIPELKGRAHVVNNSRIGPFVAGLVGRTQVAVIPVLIDQCDLTGSFWKDALERQTQEDAWVGTLAAEAHQIFAKAVKNEAYASHAHEVIFVHDTALSMVDESWSTIWTALADSEGEVRKDGFSYAVRTKLELAQIGSISLIDVRKGFSGSLVERRADMGMVLAREGQWRAIHWSRDLTGQWQQALAAADVLGVKALLLQVRDALASKGWKMALAYTPGPNGKPGHYAEDPGIIQFHPDDSLGQHASTIQVLFSLSGEGALVLLIDAEPYPDPMLEARLMTVHTIGDLKAVMVAATSS
ncbi:hypothetical protein [Bosea sp. RAC05]|uniref:hypothetical protein n=1 Tax=Bosea sp. RAC05 TaxID=1842539 RepID=UPI000856F47C|nr:hypothetical protein [Bosea sp. RAC05]AOG02780.1 hypothetical protein BSY19_4690 [Bosea sp. RAC05]